MDRVGKSKAKATQLSRKVAIISLPDLPISYAMLTTHCIYVWNSNSSHQSPSLPPKYLLSKEKRPPPKYSKNKSSNVIAKSVRYSCAIAQKPLSIRTGTFVLINATIITISKGITARRVNKPNNTKIPQKTSNIPVTLAQNSGEAKPIFSNRPGPTISGKMNF